MKIFFCLHSLIRRVLIPSKSAQAKISPVMCFVIHNSVVLSKILKIIVPLKQNLKKIQFLLYKIDYFDNNRHRQTGVKMAQRFSIFWITPLNCG